MKSRATSNSGFTLIEAIVVLLIIGIISAFIASQVIVGDTELSGQIEALKTQIRYAQGLSMNTESVWGIHRSGNTYWLFKDGNKDNRVLLPGEEDNVIDLTEKGMTLSGFTDLSFNSWGIPHSDESASDTNRISSPLSVTLSAGGKNKSLLITPNTGFIP